MTVSKKRILIRRIQEYYFGNYKSHCRKFCLLPKELRRQLPVECVGMRRSGRPSHVEFDDDLRR